MIPGRSRRTYPLAQRGVAAVTAMLVVAIATVLAVNMLWEANVDLRRTESLLLQDQARQYALGGEELARWLLAEDFRNDGPTGVDSRTQFGCIARDVEEGSLEACLTDQQGLFNLNTLIDGRGKRNPAAVEQFERLLQAIPLDAPLDAGAAREIADSVVDWIDPDQQPELSGAEDEIYTSRQPAYRPPNFWFTSTSELQAVRGFEERPDLLPMLSPHITALPPGASDKININTATVPVLMSLKAGLSPEQAESFLEEEYDDATLPQFITDFQPDGQLQQRLGVRSGWFLLTATASIGTVQARLYSLLERNDQVVRTRRRMFDAQ